MDNKYDKELFFSNKDGLNNDQLNENNQDPDSKNSIILISILKKCNITCININNINGIIIERNILLNTDTYLSILDDNPDIKKILSSSKYTCAQKTAQDKQKWPLINLLRQLLKNINYNLEPKRISDGYTKDGIKKYKRFFIIKK